MFNGLNEKQIEAVKTTEGPVLILAGAGSGKTKALTHRIAYLLKEIKVPVENVLAVTFTNKAAKEITERVGKLIASGGQERGRMPLMGTFHSISVKILRREIGHLGFKSSFSIYDEHDSVTIIKKAMRDLHIDPKKYNPKTIKNYISGAKNELLSPREYEKLASGYTQEVAAEVYLKYQDLLSRSQALDFDDLIMKCVEIFRKEPQILEKYQNLFRYILVDEYQDTNHAQYVWTKLLAEKHRNLFVIGDDWQSIYSWRGANFRNILEFEHDYPEAKVIKLEQNYRSTKVILDAAHSIIEKNEQRSKKQLWTDKTEGEPLRVYEGTDERDEARYVAETIEDKVRYGDNYFKDFAVLYRTNSQSRPLEEAFLRLNIPYKIVGGVRFYERKEIKDILAYLKFVVSGADSVAFSRIINLPLRGIGKGSLEKFEEIVSKSGVAIDQTLENIELLEGIPKKAKEGFQSFKAIIDDLREKKNSLSLVDFIEYTMKRSGYFQYLSTLDDHLTEGIEGEVRKENLGELLSVAEEFRRGKADYFLEDFLEDIALISDIDNYSESSDAVTLMTIHSAKGLEFKHVFIVGLEEEIFPHSRSFLEPQAMEEERRLMYVAVTRAKLEGFLTYARKRLYFGDIKYQMPSRFIADIPENLKEGREEDAKDLEEEKTYEFFEIPKFDPGDSVIHEKFGEGVITKIDDDEIEVSFPDIGLKRLSLLYAPIRKK